MNLNRMAELIIKLFGVSFLTACIADVTYLPHYMMLSHYAHKNLAGRQQRTTISSLG